MSSAGHIGSASGAPSSFVARWVRAGLTLGVVDFLWAVVLTKAYGRTITALWQGVAAVPFGKSMMDGGLATAFLGVGVHFSVAFTWALVFLIAHTQSATLRRLTSSGAGIAFVSAIYGPMIWTLMSLVFIPLKTGNPVPPITTRWIIQLCGHMVFVGLPVVWTVARTQRAPNTR